MRRDNNYISITHLGNIKPTVNENPLSYCLAHNMDNNFAHSSDMHGPESKKCQVVLADHCAKNWDGICEARFRDQGNGHIATHKHLINPNNHHAKTPGDVLLQNVAHKKYRTNWEHAVHQLEPFDHLVANSPMIAIETRNIEHPQYMVNPDGIDYDPVMNKLLNNPSVGMHILANIYHNMKKENKLAHLIGTRLGEFFEMNKDYFDKGLHKIHFRY